jgi:hypothetical protein
MAKLDTNRSPRSADAWAPVLDKLLHGVTHTISNRVATLAGVSDILSGDPGVPPILRALADEVPRLEEALRLLRLLATPDDEGVEALETSRLVDDAISLAALHPACRNISFEVGQRSDVPPVLARHSLLVHDLVTALVAAAQYARGEPADPVPGEAEPVDGAVAGVGLSRGADGTVPIEIKFVSDGPDLLITVGPASSATVVRGRLLSAGRG